jgi:hypothetical protein
VTTSHAGPRVPETINRSPARRFKTFSFLSQASLYADLEVQKLASLTALSSPRSLCVCLRDATRRL